MIRLLYFSSATQLLNEAELLEILKVSREKNEKDGITGMLLYLNGNILQILEGPEDKVKETFERIERDPRHYGCIIADEEEIDERLFPNWSMGFKYIDKSNTDDLKGFSEFINTDIKLEEYLKKPDVIVNLLYSFKENNR